MEADRATRDDSERRAAVGGLVCLEPVVAFSDDFKDFFNQLYLRPSQRWLSTLIWLQLGANGPAYSHIMELSLGFGCNVSSNYAQRFAHELVRLFCQRFDAEEAAILDAETDPSRRAWLDARRKLGTITGNNEARLYSLMCYTDDPHGMCVGVDRLVRMLRCWRGLTLAINARMAIAAKRQAGTSALWLGIRSLTTLGVVTVPPAKRTRATNVLRNIVNGDSVQMGELKSLAGLLEHLRPFADDVAGIMYGFHPRDSARLGRVHVRSPRPGGLLRSRARDWSGHEARLGSRVSRMGRYERAAAPHMRVGPRGRALSRVQRPPQWRAARAGGADVTPT